MNDNAIAAVGGTSRVALGGLAQRLVQDGLLDEQAMQDAIARSKEKRLSLVTHLVAANLATARDIAALEKRSAALPPIRDLADAEARLHWVNPRPASALPVPGLSRPALLRVREWAAPPNGWGRAVPGSLTWSAIPCQPR